LLKSEDRLLSYVQKRFSRWQPFAILNLEENIIFGHVTVISFYICFSTPKFVKVGSDVFHYGDLTIFKMAAVRHFGFSKLEVFCHVAFVGMPFCFLVQNFAEIGQSVDELWPNKRFSIWLSSAILNFKN